MSNYSDKVNRTRVKSKIKSLKEIWILQDGWKAGQKGLFVSSEGQRSSSCTEFNHTAHCSLSTDRCCTVHTVRLIQLLKFVVSGKQLSDC